MKSNCFPPSSYSSSFSHMGMGGGQQLPVTGTQIAGVENLPLPSLPAFHPILNQREKTERQIDLSPTMLVTAL